MGPYLFEDHELTPKEKFSLTLYGDLFEDASFLYIQRRYLLDEAILLWPELNDFEVRFQKKLDALSFEKGLIIRALTRYLKDTDYKDRGDLHLGVSIFCRLHAMIQVKETLKRTNLENDERRQAVTDALKRYMPDSWEETFLMPLLTQKNPEWVSIAADVAAFRKMDCIWPMVSSLREVHPDNSATRSLIRFIGQTNTVGTSWFLKTYLDHGNDSVAFETAMAIIRSGEENTAEIVRPYLKEKNWPILPLGILGDIPSLPLIIETLNKDGAIKTSLLALGVMGCPFTILPLIRCLEKSKEEKICAMALNAITGADLMETVFIPEKIDEDMLFEEELEKLKKGIPLYPEGEEPGKTITRLSQNPEDWHEWWKRNHNQFDSKTRYLYGRPISKENLIACLQSPETPNLFRELIHEVLVVRYGMDCGFNADLFVTNQLDMFRQ